jgi:ribonuclease HI
MTAPLLTIHTDGASRGNPGPAAFAYVIEGHGDAAIEGSGCLGELTNNQAEYEALVHALKHALQLGPQHSLLINSDSELMVKQMKGEYRVKNADLLPLYEEACELAKGFQGSVKFHHIRRALNSRADALCNEALDTAQTAVRPAMVKPQPAPKPTTLREEAVSCLREAVIAWAGGDDGPTPEEMWEKLRQLIEQRGTRLPM